MSKFNLTNWFRKKPPDKSQIVFLLDNDTINVSIVIDPNVKNIGDKYGKLLYNIDSGKLKKSIAKMLLDLSIKEPLYKSIVEDILDTWTKLIAIEKFSTNDKPYIKPSEVFKQ